jgi:hypothetical protein
MADETQNTEQDNEQTPTVEQAAEGGGRDWERLAKESFLREKKLNERLAAIEQSQAEAKDAEEQARLEAKGEYEKLAQKIKADRESEKANFEKERIRFRLESELVKAGVNNDFLIEGIASKFEGSLDDISQYVSTRLTPAYSKQPGQQVRHPRPIRSQGHARSPQI